MNLDDYNGPGERLQVVCDHYLDLATGLRDSEDKTAIWPCPSCGQPAFAANFETGAAGCTQTDCRLPATMNLLDLIAYLDPELEPDDRQSATRRFGQILGDRIKTEQKRQDQRSENRQRIQEENRWQKGLQNQRSKQQGGTEDTLF